MAGVEQVRTVAIDWREGDKREDECRTWLGSWLVTREGMEGEFFYEGPGGGQTTHIIPGDAIGLRLRWWEAASPGELNDVQRGRTNASRPYYFDENQGGDLVVSALTIAP